MPDAVLEVDRVTIRFGGLAALQDVSLVLKKGELLALVGPNGAGKTTLFNVISGFYQPTSGKIKFFGRDITGLPSHEIARLGCIRTFQNLGVFESLTVIESICVARHRRLLSGSMVRTIRAFLQPWTEAKEEAQKLARFVGLEGRENELCYNLPYGDQKKLEIARSLSAKPSVLMLDEPAAGLNEEEKKEIRKVIRKVMDLGISVLLVEHDVKLVTDISDRVVVLDYGKVIAEGLPREVMSDPKVIAAYIGEQRSRKLSAYKGAGDKTCQQC